MGRTDAADADEPGADPGRTREPVPGGAGPGGEQRPAGAPGGARAPGGDPGGTAGEAPAGELPDGGPATAADPAPRDADAARADAPGGAPEEDSAAGPAVPYWLSQVPYMLVMSALAAGIVVVAAAYFKRGPAIIAGALLLAAAFRLYLPGDWIGMLAVRRRWIDLLTLVGLAVLLIVLAWVAPQLSS